MEEAARKNETDGQNGKNLPDAPDAREQRSAGSGQAHAYELLGQIRAGGFFGKVATVATLLLVRQMKESKQYKQIEITERKNGQEKRRRIATFEEFCVECMGVSRRKIDEDLQSLAALGEEFYEAGRRMGLSYGALRSLRSLPPGERDELAKIAREDPEALKSLLEERRIEEDLLKRRLAESERISAAREQLLAEGGERLREARERIALLESPLPETEGREEADARRRAAALKEAVSASGEMLASAARFCSLTRSLMEAEQDFRFCEQLCGLGNASASSLADLFAALPWRVDFAALTLGEWLENVEIAPEAMTFADDRRTRERIDLEDHRPARAGQRPTGARRIDSAGNFAAEGVKGYGNETFADDRRTRERIDLEDHRPARAGQRPTGARRIDSAGNFAAEGVKDMNEDGVEVVEIAPIQGAKP